MSGKKNWFEEKQSAWLYRIMARWEKAPRKRELFMKLADAAEGQAAFWESKMAAQKIEIPPFTPTGRARLVGRLVRLLGPRAMRTVLAAMKVRGLSVYRGNAAPFMHRMPKGVEDVGDRHKGLAGGNLRAAVFGLNDGLVSNTGLILGVAGAGGEIKYILTSGIAGLLAGALSMAAGEYISVRSQRELHEIQIDLERAELMVYPEQEAEELALIYEARGMDLDEARRVTREMMQDPENALDLLAREELGLNPDDLGSAWGAALFSFFSFTAGAVIPLAPFALGLERTTAIQYTGALAAVSLFLVGATLSLFTGRSALYGGLRMLVIGGGTGLITFAIGRFLGVEFS